MPTDRNGNWIETDDVDQDRKYAEGRRPERTYITGTFRDDPNKRYAIKVWDMDPVPGFEWMSSRRDFVPDGTSMSYIVKKEAALRISMHGKTRYQLKAILLENSRKVERVVIQQFTEGTDKPHVVPVVAFTPEDIDRLLKFFRNIRYVRIDSDNGGGRIDDDLLNDLVADDVARAQFVRDHPDLVERLRRDESALEKIDGLLGTGDISRVADLIVASNLSEAVVGRLVETGITNADLLNVAHRREQLGLFRRLLDDSSEFERVKAEWGLRRDEDVWQHFFENNTWILGYGLRYQFGQPVGDKLEEVVRGASVANFGKRADGLLRTLGVINSLCFVELKTARTKLVSANPRPGVYQPSSELIAAVAQSQQTVQAAIENFGETLRTLDAEGFEQSPIFNLSPKALLLIGSQQEFVSEGRVRRDHYRSFELFRRALNTPEILTFDELYERARHIVEGGGSPSPADTSEPTEV